MKRHLRKFVFTSSVGWLGAVVSFLGLALVSLMSGNDQTVRATYVAMELSAWFVIIRLANASLITGLVQSFRTSWGLFRHYWIIAKFLITIVATLLLLVHTRPIGILAGAAREAATAISNYRGLQVQLVGDAVAAIVLLLVATTLSVYKPWGMTAYGRRKQAQTNVGPDRSAKPDYEIPMRPGSEQPMRKPRWFYVVGIHGIAFALLFVLFHLTGGKMPLHQVEKIIVISSPFETML